MKNLILIMFLFVPLFLNAQVNQEWVAQYNEDTILNVASDMVVDDDGNVYVTGYTYRIDSKYDFLTIKYSPIGETLWSRHFDGGTNNVDKANTISLDDSGNVFVVGVSNESDLAIVKYNAIGNELWAKFYGENNGRNEKITKKSTIINSDGDIYLSLSSTVGFGSNSGFITLKYNSNGVLLWERLYKFDESYTPIVISFDNQENILVSGHGITSVNSFDFVIIKYDENGDSIWTVIYNSPNNGKEFVEDLFVDKYNDIYVTGSISEDPVHIADILTVKFDNNGNQIWVNRYNGPGGFRDLPEAIIVDGFENVYVLGHVFSDDSKDSLSLLSIDKYGSFRWIKKICETTLNPPYGGFSLKMDNNGFIYASGILRDDTSSYDYIIQKFDADGNDLWKVVYDNNLYVDFAADLEVDNKGYVYITGNSLVEEPSINTIKYSQTVGINSISSEIPDKFLLHQNYPNPFNPATKINFDLPKAGLVSLKIYNLLGQQVSELVNQKLNAGVYEYSFDGAGLPSGVYFYRMETGSVIETKRMMLVK